MELTWYYYFSWWILGVLLFLCLLHFGYHITNGETVYFYEYVPNLYKDTKTSLLLVIPSILATFFVVEEKNGAKGKEKESS